MQTVFDGPVLPRKREQFFGASTQSCQTGERQYDLNGSLARERSRASQAADLLHARPIQPGRDACESFDHACFKTAVSLVLRIRRPQISLPGHFLRRGKVAHRTRLSALGAERVDCLSLSTNSLHHQQ